MKFQTPRLRNEKGVSMVELGLAVSLIAVAMIPGTKMLRDNVNCSKVVAAVFAGGGSKSFLDASNAEELAILLEHTNLTEEQQECLVAHLDLPG